MGFANEGFMDDVVGKDVQATNLLNNVKKKAKQVASKVLKKI